MASLGWGDGGVTYGTLTSNGQGGYTISGTHTYAEETSSNNPETLTVTVLDQTTGLVAARGTASVTIADAALSATGQNVTAWIHQTTGSIAVATFTDANTAAPVSDFTASVNWGDGSGSSPATVEPTPGGAQGQFTVLAAHTYASTGNFTIQTSITDVGSSVANPTSTATVATPTTGSVAATAGSLFSGVVASFNANPSYAQSATINWGDGSNPSSGTITPGQGNTFTVSGSHTYTAAGVYNLQVQVNMSQGGNVYAYGPAVVADAALARPRPACPRPGSASRWG